MTIKLVESDLLESKSKYIVHQCNCITTSAAGLAKSLFDKYPYADIYKNRTKDDFPGSIKICGNGIDERFVIAIFGQYGPGKSCLANYSYDNKILRLTYFKNALERIKEISNLESISFPYGIGCGLAGGNWENYLKLIEDFSNSVNAEVSIFKL